MLFAVFCCIIVSDADADADADVWTGEIIE